MPNAPETRIQEIGDRMERRSGATRWGVVGWRLEASLLFRVEPGSYLPGAPTDPYERY